MCTERDLRTMLTALSVNLLKAGQHCYLHSLGYQSIFSQPEVIPQMGSFIFGPKDASSLQFRH
jgi:hypothetical protein